MALKRHIIEVFETELTNDLKREKQQGELVNNVLEGTAL